MDAYTSREVSLPAEVLSVLPSDPYLQLELAHKIACWTYQRQVQLQWQASIQGAILVQCWYDTAMIPATPLH